MRHMFDPRLSVPMKEIVTVTLLVVWFLCSSSVVFCEFCRPWAEKEKEIEKGKGREWGRERRAESEPYTHANSH